MARYFAFVMGALLFFGGAFALVDGYSIIQIERGWAGVIAGATAMTGGIITAAIGFLIRAVEGLASQPKLQSADISLQDAWMAAPGNEPGLSPRQVSPDREPLGSDPRQAELFDEAPSLAVTLAPEEPPKAKRPTIALAGEHSAQVSSPHVSAAETPEPETAQTELPQAEAPHKKAAPPVFEAVSEKTVYAMPRIPVTHMNWPEPADPAPSAFAPEAAAPLRRSFDSAAIEAVKPQPVQGFSPHADPQPEPLFEASRESAEPDAEENEPALDWLKRRPERKENGIVGGEEARRAALAGSLASAPEAASVAAPAADKTLLRRYDAGGLTYFLYSDGSIDAQSAQGGRKSYSSMTELRAALAPQKSDPA